MLIIDATSIEEIKRQLQPYLGGYAWTTDQDRKGFALCVGDCGGNVMAELTSLLESKHKPNDDDLLEHALFHAIVARIERQFHIEPCPAIRTADNLIRGIVGEARSYLAWMEAEEKR